MERLTKKEMLVGHEVHYISGDDCFEVGTMAEKFMGKAIDTLAQYEDTGLSPETVSDLLDRFTYFYRTVEGLDLVDPVHFGAFVDRVKRWQQAEKDGRLLVLPCKVGQPIWVESCIRGRVTCIDAPDIAWIIEKMERFGAEFFLTREEAEAALKKREER